MIEYGELVQYIKDNHISWHTDLFEVLRGFFEGRAIQQIPQNIQPVQQEIVFSKGFHHPDDGEYTQQDVLDLFST